MGTELEVRALEILRNFVVSYSACGECELAYQEAKAVLDETRDCSGFEAAALKRGFKPKPVFVKTDARGSEYGGFEAEACGNGSVKVSKYYGSGKAWTCVFPTATVFGDWAEDET